MGCSLLTRLLDSPDRTDEGRQLRGRPPAKSWPRGSVSGPPVTYLAWVSAAFWNDLCASGVKNVLSLEAHTLTALTTPHLTEGGGEQAETSPLMCCTPTSCTGLGWV